MRKKILLICLLLLSAFFPTASFAVNIEKKIAAMITAYFQGTKGVKDPIFLKKVNELDNELRISLEKDNNLQPCHTLLVAAYKLKRRKAARAMFKFAL